MEGERQLLAQWGDAPPVLASSGEEPGRDIGRWVQDLRRGEPHDTLPMAPLLAGQIVAEPPERTGSAGHCAARQWWVANRLRQAPGAGEAIWQAWHLQLTRYWMDRRDDKLPYPDAGGATDYPSPATLIGLEGAVLVRVERDARGRYKSGSITSRNPAAGTLPGRAVPMFEDMLDAPSLARARQLTNEQAAAAEPGASGAGAGSKTFKFEWKMAE